MVIGSDGGAKCQTVIHKHGLVVRFIDATTGCGSLFGQSESDADGSSGQENAIKGSPLRGDVHWRGCHWSRF